MSSPRGFRRFSILAVLLACLVSAAAVPPARAEEPEVLKGTVKSQGPGVLFLKDVSFPDETLPRKDIKVNVDKETAFFHGIKKVPREDVTPECRVLLKCTQVGKERKALMVRIIGGK